MCEPVGRASDPRPGDHHEGNKETSPREGDLDVLSASGQAQTSSSATNVQERRAQIDSCWCNIPAMFVDPASRTAYYLMALVTVAVVYNWIVIILRVAFEDMREGDYSSKMFRVLDIISDVIYLMDVAIQSRTAFLEDGCLVQSLPETVRHYRNQPRFILDVLSVVPLTKIFYFLSAICPLPFFQAGSDSISAPGMRVLRLLKYPSMIRFFEKTDSRTNNPNLLRAFKLSLHLWLVIHWICCFYYLISRYEGLGINDWVYPNSTEYSTFRRKYIFCMYWSTMTLTTIGERPWPVTDVEHIFTGFTFLIGVFVFAAVVGNVGDVISNMNAARHDFLSRMDQIKFYLNHRHVPEHLQDQIKRWAEYTWARTKAIDEHSIMQMLPSRLRTEVAIHVHLQALKKVRIFEQCEEGLLRELVLKLRPSIYSPGEYICRIGEIGREMYIIDHGKVEILFPDRKNGTMKQVAVMMPGNYFGEISLLKLDDGQNKRTADVRSIGFSELLCLSRRDLMSALMEYPEAKKVLETQARERMQQTKRTSSEGQHTSATAGPVEVKKPTRRSARTIFSEVMKQEGFANLLSSKANQELGEMRKILKELQEVKKHLSGTSVYQLAKQCQCTEQQLASKNQELQRLQTQLLDQRRQIVSATSVIRQTLPTGGRTLPRDGPPLNKGYSLSAARQSIKDPSSNPTLPRHNSAIVVLPDDPVSLHKHVNDDHPVQDTGVKVALGGAGDELVVPKIHVTLNDHHAGDSNTENSADSNVETSADSNMGTSIISIEIDSDRSSGITVFQSPLPSGTDDTPREGVPSTSVAQSDSSFNLAAPDESSQTKRDPKHPDAGEGCEKNLPQPEETASNSSFTDTSYSTSTCSSGGRWADPKPAKPKPRYKSKEVGESGSRTDCVGDGCETKQSEQDELQGRKSPVAKCSGKVRTKLNACLSSEGFSAMSTASESWATESVLSSSCQTGSSDTHAADTWGRVASLRNLKVLEETEKQGTGSIEFSEQPTVVTEVTSVVADQTSPFEDCVSSQQQQQPWNDPTMLEAAGISPEDLAYLEENEPRGDDGNAISNDEDDCEFIPATRVKSDFDKRVSKDDLHINVVTCRKIDDTQLSILLAKRREANDSPDYIVESVKKPAMSRSAGTSDHGHSIHAVVDSTVSEPTELTEQELAPRQALDSTATGYGRPPPVHLLSTALRYTKKPRYAKVDFVITPPASSAKAAYESDSAVCDTSRAQRTQEEGKEDTMTTSAEPACETEEAAQRGIKSDETSRLSNIKHDSQSEDAEQNRDWQGAGQEAPTGLRENDENEKKYPVSILKKPKSDISSEEPRETIMREESVDTSHQADCASVGEEDNASPTIAPSSKDSTDSFGDTFGLAEKDDGCRSDHQPAMKDADMDSPTVDNKLPNGKKSKRGRMRDIDIEVGMFPLKVKNETSQGSFGCTLNDSLPDISDTSLQEHNQAMPTPDAEYQEPQDDQDQQREGNLAALRRRYSASRYRRRSIDQVHDFAESFAAESWPDSDLPIYKDVSSEAVSATHTSSSGTIRKHSEKLDSLIATFDSPKKRYFREDSVNGTKKNNASTQSQTVNSASTETTEEHSTCDFANVDRGSKAVAAVSKSFSVGKKGSTNSKEESKDGDASKKSPIPANGSPIRRKTLRRRSLTKRLSNPGGKKEIQTSEKSPTACSKEVRPASEKRSENDSVGQESASEGTAASGPAEKMTEQDKDRDKKPVSPGPDGETRHSSTRACPVTLKVGNCRTSGRTSDSALGEYDPLPKKRSASILGFDNFTSSSPDCHKYNSRADSQSSPQRKKSTSISPGRYKDKIQHSANRLKSYEAMDRANNSALTSDDSNSSSPTAPETTISVSMHTSYNATDPEENISHSFIDHVADQASIVVENLMQSSSPSFVLQQTPSTGGKCTDDLLDDEYQPFGSSVCSSWLSEHDDDPVPGSIVTDQESVIDVQDGELEAITTQDHLQLSVENNSDQVSVNAMQGHFQIYAGTSGGHVQVEDTHDHAHIHVENTQDHTQLDIETTVDHTHIGGSEDQSDSSQVDENSRASETEGSQEDSSLMERIVSGAMVEALRLNPGLLASVTATPDNEEGRVVGEAGSLILLADFGVDDDDEGALSDISGCGDQSDANSDLDDM